MMLPYSSKSICLMPILLLLAQPAIAQQWKPGADSQFEVGTQLRPWTMRDEGMETIIENCRSMAGVNSIYLVAVMHQEHRPYQAKKFPHNPKRSTFMAEDSTVAWSPDITLWKNQTGFVGV